MKAAMKNRYAGTWPRFPGVVPYREPVLTNAFKQANWSGESRRDAVGTSHDRFGEPVDRVQRPANERMERPYNR